MGEKQKVNNMGGTFMDALNENGFCNGQTEADTSNSVSLQSGPEDTEYLKRGNTQEPTTSEYGPSSKKTDVYEQLEALQQRLEQTITVKTGWGRKKEVPKYCNRYALEGSKCPNGGNCGNYRYEGQIGCGKEIHDAITEILALIEQRNTSIENMTTPAFCEVQ